MPRLSAFRSRFFWKNYAAFAVLFLSTTMLVSAIVFVKISTRMRSTVEDNLREKLELLVPQSRQLFAGNQEAATSVVQDLARASHTRITLISEGGQVFADSDFESRTMENHWQRPEVQMALVAPYGWSERISETAMQKKIYAAKSITAADGSRVGVARISIATDQIVADMRNLLMTMAAVTVVGVFMALGLGWTLAQRVSVPIWEMVQVAEAMRGGKYSERVRTITHDEVGRLGDTLNQLGSELTSKITELHRLETVRRDFVANVSHEIKTPLTSIKGYVETLLEGAIDDQSKSIRFLEKIERNAERLTNLVQDLLSLAKIEATEGTLKLHSIDWSEVVHSVMARNEDAVHQKNLRVKVDLPAVPVRVMGDREAMTQVLDNLLTNAIKYTSDGGRITISLASRGAWGKLTVADTGIGIPAEHLDRIFERFYRVDKARSRELGGTGLGLSIVKHLISAMGGEIHVESSLGAGSSFSVRLRGDH